MGRATEREGEEAVIHIGAQLRAAMLRSVALGLVLAAMPGAPAVAGAVWIVQRLERAREG